MKYSQAVFLAVVGAGLTASAAPTNRAAFSARSMDTDNVLMRRNDHQGHGENPKQAPSHKGHKHFKDMTDAEKIAHCHRSRKQIDQPSARCMPFISTHSAAGAGTPGASGVTPDSGVDSSPSTVGAGNAVAPAPARRALDYDLDFEARAMDDLFARDLENELVARFLGWHPFRDPATKLADYQATHPDSAGSSATPSRRDISELFSRDDGELVARGRFLRWAGKKLDAHNAKSQQKEVANLKSKADLAQLKYNNAQSKLAGAGAPSTAASSTDPSAAADGSGGDGSGMRRSLEYLD